jgi:WD40 repeat protein
MYELLEIDRDKGVGYIKVAYNADGSRIVRCGSGTNAIVVWSTGDCSQPVSNVPIDPTMTVGTLSLDCDHDQMAALLTPKDGHAVVKSWKIDTGEEIRSLQITTDGIRRAVFAKNNAMLVTHHYYSDKICVWNLEGDRAALSTTIDGDLTFDVSRSGDVIAVGYLVGTIRFYDALTGAKLAVYRGHTSSIFSIQFSTQGDRLVSTSLLDQNTRVWDTTKGALSANPPSATDSCLLTRIEFSSNGKYIAAIARRDPHVFVFDGETGKVVTILAGHAESVAAFAFSADDSVLASVSEDGVVLLWDMRQEVKHPRTLSQSQSTKSLRAVNVTFNADSNLLAIVYRGDRTFVVKIYDVSAGVELLQSEPNGGDSPHLIQFSPSEPLIRLRRVAPDEQVRIWDHASGTVEEHAYNDNVHSTWVFPYRINYGWIVSSRTEKRLFWLPWDRKAHDSDCMDVHGDRLAIGSWFGTLTLLDVSRLQDVQR